MDYKMNTKMTAAEREEYENLLYAYSDTHKDAYGFRPKEWSWQPEFETLEGLRKEMDRIEDIICEQIKQEEIEYAQAAEDFEAEVKAKEAAGITRTQYVEDLHDLHDTGGCELHLKVCLGLSIHYNLMK